MLLLKAWRQGIGAVRLGGRYPGGPPGRPLARGRLRPRRRGLPGLREADNGNDHRDRPLAQDDRDGHAEEPRARRRAGLCSRPSRWRSPTSAIAASTRSSPSTSLPSGSSRRPHSVPYASTRPGRGRLPLLGRAPLRAGASPEPNELADRLREGAFSVDRVLVEDLRPVPAVCAIKAAPGRMNMDRNTGVAFLRTRERSSGGAGEGWCQLVCGQPTWRYLRSALRITDEVVSRSRSARLVSA